MAAHKVTAPLVVVQLKDGRYSHIYEGGLLPDDADPGHVEQLVADGMVEKVGGSGKAKAEPDPPAPGGDMPPKTGSKAKWTEYALANGKTEEDLADLSRDGIRDLFLTS